MDDLDKKLNVAFDGKVVKKELLHRIKKGTNVPTFVLEFLLARYCASNDAAEIAAGMEAVLATLQDNYVRPDEANAAQSKVATKGKHRFIDKVHVKYVEKEKRHWATLENFNSQRIGIGQKFYKDNERLLEGGIWAEVVVAHNEVDADDYAFYIEDLRPIQISKFDFEQYCVSRDKFTRDEWLDVLLRSVGLEPSKLSKRVKLHFVARLAPLVELNFNFVELGPRGTGKSYFYSEFSPYSTLISGGQGTKATLFYNNARRKVGLVGFWDNVAFDEVGNIKIKDQDSIQIMKDYMANGRFSRGVEVIADASLSFVGNIDLSIDQIVHSPMYDLFQPLPPELDLAVMDRFACYLPGWEMPKNSSEFLAKGFGLITDYLAEAFHYTFKHTNRYEEVTKRIKLGKSIEGRDEKGIKKTVCAFLKILHPATPPNDSEFEEYVAYAVESRRRVKEQMNKRKPDDEFAMINLSYINSKGEEIVVYCPESQNAPATQTPVRKRITTIPEATDTETVLVRKTKAKVGEKPSVSSAKEAAITSQEEVEAKLPIVKAKPAELKEKHFKILYGDIGYTYENMFGEYIKGAKTITVEDPYLRMTHQIQNFVRFCEVAVKAGTVEGVNLITGFDDVEQQKKIEENLLTVAESLMDHGIKFKFSFKPELHDREISLDTGWTIKIGRGFDIYQKPLDWFAIGANDMELRPCLETSVDIFKQ